MQGAIYDLIVPSIRGSAARADMSAAGDRQRAEYTPRARSRAGPSAQVARHRARGQAEPAAAATRAQQAPRTRGSKP